MLLLGAVGVVLAVLARRWPGRVTAARATAVILFLALAGPLLALEGLHRYAALLLAAGAAVQPVRRRAASVARIAPAPAEAATVEARDVSRRRLLVVGGLAVAGAAAGVHGGGRLRESLAAARMAAARPRAPNLLLLVLDTVRAQSLGLYGHDRPTTPNLDRLGASSVVFERAVAAAPWTLPSHASLFTGRMPHELGLHHGRPLGTGIPTLAEALVARGYRTAGFVGNNIYCGRGYGLARGFQHYEDYPVSPQELLLASSLARTVANERAVRWLSRYYGIIGRKTVDDVNREFLRWLDRTPGRPYFAFLNYSDAHEPYQPPERFLTRFADGRPRDEQLWHSVRQAGRFDLYQAPPADHAANLAAYEAAIAWLDERVAGLLDELDRRGGLDETLVVITSDHGEEFGEHGRFGHGSSLYRLALHVPLMLRYPGRLSNHREAYPVSLRDLGATMLALLDPEADVPIAGESFARLTQGAAGAATPVLVSELSPEETQPDDRRAEVSVLEGSRHYLRTYDGREELYDWDADPWERADLATEAAPEVLERFRSLAAEHSRRQPGGA
jgi:arylsulfatase A-like enzyme